ncbi:MAG: MATE family efflux transporter [Clostridiales bacterium]|nr:MATE family efflux transporter [Clostridiales bacterium]
MQSDDGSKGAKRVMMLETPISRLIPQMAAPTIIALLINSIYSMADTYFVSSLGTSATAAVGVNMSIDLTIMMAGSFLAIGANSYISRLLGAKQNHMASKTLSTAFFSAMILGSLVMIPGLMFTGPLVQFLGATEDSMGYAVEYANYILLVAPFMASSFVLNHCLRSEGSPVYSMIGMVSGAVLNIILDPIFIFNLGLGVKGAAIATAISKIVSFCILIFPYAAQKSVLKISLKYISYSKDIIREITLMGLPSFLRMGLGVVSNILINKIAGSYSDSALAAISVVTRIMTFPTSAMLGFGQGFMPVAGYNWGARSYDRVKSSYRFSSIAGVLFIAAGCALIAVFSEQIILLFTEADESLVEIGRLCLISQCIAMPLNAWVIVVNMLYSALGKPVGAIILGTTRQGFCLIPVLFILPSLFGIDGLSVSQAVADGFSFLITIPFAIFISKSIATAQKNELKLPRDKQLN